MQGQPGMMGSPIWTCKYTISLFNNDIILLHSSSFCFA